MDLLARAADLHPDAPAIVTGDRTIVYAELDAAASGVADVLLSSGTLGTHPVAFWGERTPEAVAAAWGIPRAGVAAVPVDPRLPPATAMEATRSAGVRGLWTAPDGGFERLVGRRADRPEKDLGGLVVMTSGSEGAPKGVVITPDNIAASVSGSRRRIGNGPDDAWLCVLPLFHVGGLAILWRQAEAGAPVMLHGRFEPAAAASALAQAAFASFVPVMLKRVLGEGARGSGEGAVLVGGAAVDRGLLERARDAGIRAVPTYGMTETSSQIATPAPQDPLDGTVGEPLPGAEIRVVRDGEPVVGGEGRIEVRGPMVSPGYVGEQPRREDAWFATGDVGVMTGEGRLRVLGRADAVIVTGGENVHPAGVEAALRRLGPIADARVFGVPDDEWGMVVAAEVETEATVADLDELARALPPAWRPRRWEIVERVRGKLE